MGRSHGYLGQIAVALFVAVILVLAIMIYARVHKIGGQVTDVTGLVSNQAARVDKILGAELDHTDLLLRRQTKILNSALAQEEVTLHRVLGLQQDLDRNTRRVLRRFQLLFRRLLRNLKTQLPAQTQNLVHSIERGLQQLLRPQRR